MLGKDASSAACLSQVADRPVAADHLDIGDEVQQADATSRFIACRERGALHRRFYASSPAAIGFGQLDEVGAPQVPSRSPAASGYSRS